VEGHRRVDAPLPEHAVDRYGRDTLVVGDVLGDPADAKFAALGEHEAFMLAAGVAPGDFQHQRPRLAVVMWTRTVVVRWLRSPASGSASDNRMRGEKWATADDRGAADHGTVCCLQFRDAELLLCHVQENTR